MAKKLSDEIIAARMVELRNLRQLHARDRQQIAQLKQRVKTLEQEKADDRAYFEELIQKQAIQIAELQSMVFGKKRKTELPPDDGVPSSGSPASPRTPGSYRRPVPPDAAITSEVVVPLPDSCICGGSFDTATVTAHERFEEDIPLPELTPGYQPHLVTKYIVERGVCSRCGKAAATKDLGGAKVALGPNVRLLVTHLISVGGMSYQQVIDLLATLYGLAVSKGEVVGILQQKHEAWLPAYHQLKADIRAAPVVHADETPWAIQQLQGAGYAWVLADAGSPKVCYELAQSRGAPVAKALFGQATAEAFAGIRITDDYGPYRNPELPGIQQLCWAHLYRAIRDTRHNANLPKEQVPYVRQWYETFAAIYQDLRMYLSEPYDEVVRTTQAAELWEQLHGLATERAPRTGEPDKLTRLKAQLQRAGKDRLLICLTKDTPCDNNRAERELRQLVLKRKRSFGSQTEKGANAFATILSVCTTTWRIQSQGYFAALAGIG